MESRNRIEPTSVTPTIGRQTPDNAFGSVMARTLGETVRRGSAVVGGMLYSAPVVSAAVSGVSGIVSVVSPNGPSPVVPLTTTAAGTSAPLSHAAPAAGVAAERSESWDMLEAQRLLQQNGHSFNMQYLQLQDSMQKESREFNTISNVMKVRHDSAKAAINNIR